MVRLSIPGKDVCSAVPRGLALFLGLFSLLNIVGELRSPGFDANLWWINLPGNWRLMECGLLAWSAGCMLWFAGHQRLTGLQQRVLTGTFGSLVLVAIGNMASFYRLLASGAIQAPYPVSFSAFVAACLAIIIAGLWWPDVSTDTRRSRIYLPAMCSTAIACGLIFPIAQMICFGMTDYRRPADVIVVFGAKVHANGQLSSVLEERVRTGCELYHSGLARHILFSGGPGVGNIHETDAMRKRAIELGVAADAITLDRDGLDTESTVINTLRLGQARGWNRILAVSQFFHLPRIKLAFHRHRSEVYTVPAVRLYQLRYLPYFMLREVAAWWLYYVRPLWSNPVG
jgi:uncharacterized SAM-binding protein YcdF (DUF218 family)